MTVAAATPAERLRTYSSFVRLEHTLFSLPLIVAGVFSQPGPRLPWTRWALIVAAAVGARTAALALNRLIDRRIDALNPRTQSRELPSGRMRTGEALALLVAAGALYFGAAAAIHPLCLWLSPIPLVAFTVYPYLKRFTAFCHFGVGFALALAPLGGYLAAHPDCRNPWGAIVLALFTLFWVTGFDIIYAQLDEAFDREHGVYSMVVWRGRESALRTSADLHGWAVTILGMGIAVGISSAGGPLWQWRYVPVLAALLAVGLLLRFEQKAAENVDLAFFKINVLVGFAVLALVLVTRAAAGGF